jgi:glycerophosphoryl diester phosphodiesterase
MLNLPKLIGHRGVKNLSPENTIESIELAQKIGLSWVEFDVKISKDFIPIVFHDDTLERTTNGTGLPIDFCYDNLKKLDAGSFFYKKKTNIFIPTLEDILFLVSKKNIGLNIELKPNKGFEKENVNSIAKILKKNLFLNQFYFSSFDWNSLVMMKEIFPDQNYGLLIHDFTNNKKIDDILTMSNKYNFFSCGLNKDIINSEIIHDILSNDLIITVFSEKNLNFTEANELWSIGIKSIFIDDPTDFKIG